MDKELAILLTELVEKIAPPRLDLPHWGNLEKY